MDGGEEKGKNEMIKQEITACNGFSCTHQSQKN